MADLLGVAREFAEKLRFSGDTLKPRFGTSPGRLQPLLDRSYMNELRISPEVTPGLATSLKKVCGRLLIPDEALHAFVFPASEMQAECFADNELQCIVRFSSSLVDILDESEFQFVAAHEIGHFLLQHGMARISAKAAALEYYMQARYQEVSVDRIGLFGCGSIDVAISAMMKTLSGLTGRHLRKDVSAFLSQLNKASGFKASAVSTHPSILVRCRALLWFSMACHLTPEAIDAAEDQVRAIDERIKNDMHKFVDKDAREMIDKARADVLIWMAALRVVQSGAFSRHQQEEISNKFGTDILDKLKGYLSDLPAENAEEIVYSRVTEARRALEQLIPESFEREVQHLKTEYGV